MSQRQPVQKRSRERIEQILLASADLLAKTGDANQLTTTSVSKRSGVPVATIYRYFADRMAIIATLIDREMEEIDRLIVDKLNEMETVTPEILLRTMMVTHLEHFQSSRRSIVLWFGARQSSRVLGRIDRRYKYMGDWVFDGTIASGLIKPDAPPFGGELIVWSCDRVFELIFRVDRAPEEQQAILDEFLEMLTAQIMKYATADGVNGIPQEAFFEKAGPWDPAAAFAKLPG
jgi:AcrR family transcriptional regulator